jgi:hypothetical protein
MGDPPDLPFNDEPAGGDSIARIIVKLLGDKIPLLQKLSKLYLTRE